RSLNASTTTRSMLTRPMNPSAAATCLAKCSFFGTPPQLHFAKQAAAALGFIGLVNMDRVVVEAFNDRLTQSMPAARGRRCLWRLLDFLGKIEAAGPSNLAQSLRTFSLKSSGKGI